VTARGRALVLALAALVVGLPAHAQRATADASQVTALIGLARTARDQGRYKESLSHFLDAERRQPFAAALLVELFWVAHRVDAATARGAGERILKMLPGESSVRDALIGLLAGERNEAAVRALAEGGARVGALAPSARRELLA
jgi:hypothetical protein